MDKMNEVERCVSCGTTTPYVMKQSIHEMSESQRHRETCIL